MHDNMNVNFSDARSYGFRKPSFCEKEMLTARRLISVLLLLCCHKTSCVKFNHIILCILT